MKIAVIVPNVGMPKAEMEERRKHLLRVCHPETSIDLFRNETGPAAIESQMEHEEAAVEIVKQAIRLEKEGYHALIPWCGGDPGLVACREAVRVPVVGPLQSSCIIASTLGYRFGVITPLSKNIKLVEQRIWNLKLHPFLAGIRAVDIPVLDLRKNLDKLLDILTQLIQKMVSEDGADAVVTTCMGFFGISEALMKRVPVPVVDPGWAAVRMAETYVTMRISHAKGSYQFPKN
ncbi:MAG TPA: aspartate/glutamate racemase family protein [Thermodesulfobacteriota bacterium]|nr:aspartate/glutamate racemase family protein [Thermodesulfobacteriota bacterium]